MVSNRAVKISSGGVGYRRDGKLREFVDGVPYCLISKEYTMMLPN